MFTFSKKIIMAMLLTIGTFSIVGCSGGEADYSFDEVQINPFAFLSSGYVYVEDNATEIIELQVRSKSSVEFAIIGGEDSALYDINSTTGIITYAAGVDGVQLYIQDPEKIYLIVVQAINADGDEESMVIRVQIVKDLTLVKPVIDTGVVTNPNLLPSLDEIITTVTAQSASGTTITYALSGADSGFFEIDENGNLRFKTIPTFDPKQDANEDNVFEVTVEVSDAYQTSTVDIHVTIAQDSDLVKPIISTPSSLDYVENDNKVIYIAATSGTEYDISYSLVPGYDESDFDIDPLTGALSFVKIPDYEAPHDSNSDNVYEVEVRVTDQSTYANEMVQLFSITVNGVNEGVITSYTDPTVEGVSLNNLIENSQYTVIFTSLPIVPEDNVVYTVVNQDGDGTIFSIVDDSLIINTPAVPCTPFFLGCIEQTESFTVTIGRADEYFNYTQDPITISVTSE